LGDFNTPESHPALRYKNAGWLGFWLSSPLAKPGVTIMADFVQDLGDDYSHTTQVGAFSPSPSRRPLRVLLLGTREDVTETIKNLHQRGFAAAGDWTKPVACPHAGEKVSQMLPHLPAGSVVSILTKYLNQG
jgi:hypothetical protein